MVATANVKYDVVNKNGKFIVTKDGNPIVLPSSTGATIVTEFESKSDAERYMGILKALTSRR